jgi:hypothetical protein
MIYIGIDDTDMVDTRGTGHLARDLAAALEEDFDILAVTRHQLLDDPRRAAHAKKQLRGNSRRRQCTQCPAACSTASTN